MIAVYGIMIPCIFPANLHFLVFSNIPHPNNMGMKNNVRTAN